MIVVDASALLDVLLRAPGAETVTDRLFTLRNSLHAPHLLDLEVAQVLRRHVRSGELDAQRGEAALDDLADFPLRRHSHEVFLPRIWSLRDNLTAYDAVYVALAETLDAPLVTRDRRLAAASGHHARIDLV